MPGFDGTGPFGEGPMTGGGFGYCGAGIGIRRGFRRFGRGFGRGLGRGFGFRARNWAPVVNYTAEDELKLLQRERDLLDKEIEALKSEITNLKEE